MEKQTMRNLTLLIILTLAFTVSLTAQGRRQVGQIDDPNTPDRAHFQLSVIREYDSLKDLYTDSDLVVQGDVKSVLPTVDLSLSKSGHNLVTGVLFTITATYRGTPLPQVVVVQSGGTIDKLERIPDQFHLMQQGEHYILFLVDDSRLSAAGARHSPTYAVTGAWTGHFRDIKGVLQLSPATNPALRARYDGRAPSVLLGDLAAIGR